MAVIMKRVGSRYECKTIYEEFHTPCDGAGKLFVRQLYITAGAVHVCTGRKRVGGSICKCFVYCNSSRDSVITFWRYLVKENSDVMKLLLLAALSRFFVMGVTLVGLPFIVRTILGLDAKYYGTAESTLAVATIIGSIAAGLLTGKIKTGRLAYILAAIGTCIIPAGVIFLFPSGTMTRYGVNIAAFCGMQIAISIFSIFAVSIIQQNTPDHLIGKVMAYTSAVTMCAQPVGQMVYGFLFDRFREDVHLVLVPTGAAVCMIGLLSAGFFKEFQKN